MRKERGITLIALVITIIVLLILAGVSISAITGENGLLGKARSAKEKTDEADVKEKVEMAVQSAKLNEYGTLEYDELERELENSFGEDNYTIEIVENGYKIIVGKNEFFFSETGSSLVNGENSEPIKNEYGFYFDELYEGILDIGGMVRNVGFIYHEDGSAEMFMSDETATLGKLILYQEMPASETTFEDMESSGAIVSKDGLTITIPTTDTSNEQIYTCTLNKAHGLYYGETYIVKNLGEVEQNGTTMNVGISCVFNKDGTGIMTEMLLEQDGTVVETYSATIEGIEYSAHEYKILVPATSEEMSDDTTLWISSDGNYIMFEEGVLLIRENVPEEDLSQW